VTYDLEYLLKRSVPEPNTGCWLWLLGVSRDGYAQVGKAPWSGHAIASDLRLGPLPSGMERDHICRQRSCVNPDHIQYITDAENIARADYTVNHRNKRKTHCKRGHELSGDNLYLHKRAAGFSRECKTCRGML